ARVEHTAQRLRRRQYLGLVEAVDEQLVAELDTDDGAVLQERLQRRDEGLIVAAELGRIPGRLRTAGAVDQVARIGRAAGGRKPAIGAARGRIRLGQTGG